MSKKANQRYYTLLLASALVAIIAFITQDTLFYMVAMLFAFASLASLFCIKPSPLLAALPLAVCAFACFNNDNYYFSAISAVLLCASVGVAVCMRLRFSRGRTVAISGMCTAVGVLFAASIIVVSIYGSLTFKNFVDFFYTVRDNAVYELYNEIVNSVNVLYDSLGESVDATSYAIAYIRYLIPQSIGAVLLLVITATYFFTELAKQFVKIVDREYLKQLPGINGQWEYVLPRSSAVAFIIFWFCLFIGGDALKTSETAAFYAVMMPLLGGVLVMAFRSIRDRVRRRGWADLIFPTIIAVFFLSDYILSILSIIGLVSTFKMKPGDDDKCKN